MKYYLIINEYYTIRFDNYNDLLIATLDYEDDEWEIEVR